MCWKEKSKEKKIQKDKKDSDYEKEKKNDEKECIMKSNGLKK